MKSIVLVFVVAVLHLTVSVWLSIRSFGHVFSAFDTGRELTFLEKIIYWVVDILFFPIVTVFENSNYQGESMIEQYSPFVLNSMLWGILIVFFYKLIFHSNKQ